jgi:hypothetical protein
MTIFDSTFIDVEGRGAFAYVPLAVHDRPGVGTELKRLLARLGIQVTEHCQCHERARQMDERGVDWCRDNIAMIVGWLKEEAAARSLPFVDRAARWLVRKAIQRALP